MGLSSVLHVKSSPQICNGITNVIRTKIHHWNPFVPDEIYANQHSEMILRYILSYPATPSNLPGNKWSAYACKIIQDLPRCWVKPVGWFLGKFGEFRLKFFVARNEFFDFLFVHKFYGAKTPNKHI